VGDGARASRLADEAEGLVLGEVEAGALSSKRRAGSIKFVLLQTVMLWHASIA
jgi:hypothetical protein